jgi:hypothetical protein
MLVRRRGAIVRHAIGLPEPGALARRLPLAALLAAGVLLGSVAAQPRVEWTTARKVRSDAEAFVVLDTSRSMLARSSPASPIRYTRATSAALRFRNAFQDVPIGIVSFTDRVLPHLFPSVDDDVFVATLRRSIGIDRPPPQGTFSSTATRLGALESVVSRRFFTPTSRARLLFVITDGESVPISGAKIGIAFRRPPGVDTVFLHVWDSSERVFNGAEPEPQYSPDPRSRGILDSAAETLGGYVYDEDELGAAIAKAQELLGDGPTVTRGERRKQVALAPYLAGFVFLPLAILLWRRDR